MDNRFFIAKRAARYFKSGDIVNLGVGIIMQAEYLIFLYLEGVALIRRCHLALFDQDGWQLLF